MHEKLECLLNSPDPPQQEFPQVSPKVGASIQINVLHP